MSNRDECYENSNLGWPDKENWQRPQVRWAKKGGIDKKVIFELIPELSIQKQQVMQKYKQKNPKGTGPKVENSLEDSRKHKKASMTEAW